MSRKTILVINCGSSSLKYQLCLMPDGTNLVKGNVERIGDARAFMTQKRVSDNKEYRVDSVDNEMKDHKSAFKEVMKAILSPDYGVLKDAGEIDIVSHRIVHGGEKYSDAAIVDEKVLADITELCDLAPLHNPAHLQGIFAAEELLPKIPQTVTFDTAFHQTMPDYCYRYAIPEDLYKKFALRKYGFHGTSHKYVAEHLARIINKPLESLNLITCHLGNGASVTAIQNGKSYDTSMGVTPLEGLVMGTRCGDIDPTVVPYLCSKGYKPEEINTILQKKSGLLGLSGKGSDMRDIIASAEAGEENGLLAFNSFIHRVKKYIGAYTAELGRVDALIFTGGIGENSYKVRAAICANMESIGIKIDLDENKKHIGTEGLLSKPDSSVSVFVIPTNEEYQIAMDGYRITHS